MAIDWTHIYTRYAGQWVAIKDDEKTVVASGETAKEALAKARAKHYPNAALFRVPTGLLPHLHQHSVAATV